jgi:DNA processing protein
MEAPSKSGALITAYLANDYGRDVYVLPGSLDNPRAIGCLGLVNRGAQIILGEGYLLEALGAMPQLAQVNPLQLPNVPPELAQVFQTLVNLSQELAQESVPFDLIVQTTNLGSGFVSSTLLQLELLGLVSQLPGMRYQPSTSIGP